MQAGFSPSNVGSLLQQNRTYRGMWKKCYKILLGENLPKCTKSPASAKHGNVVKKGNNQII